MQKRMSLLLFPVALLLTGCTPEEKTMLLPQAASSGDEAENRTATGDFTVKKIYTYTYDTLPQLGKSAFLSGCGDNEIHILSLGGQESGEVLEYREVDYRYGFYDVAGAFWEIREDLSDPPGEEMAKDLYIERILPSPDGKQLLVYIRSSFWDRLIVRLYTLGEAEPLLLYEGTSEASDAIRGSFSPDGRWVTFDAGGASVSFNRLQSNWTPPGIYTEHKFFPQHDIQLSCFKCYDKCQFQVDMRQETEGNLGWVMAEDMELFACLYRKPLAPPPPPPSGNHTQQCFGFKDLTVLPLS